MTNSGLTSLLLAGVLGLACTPAPLPAPVSQADAVASSKAGQEAKKLAPQAYAAAEKLRKEAESLYDEGETDEAAAAGEQAIAAYNEAFALARAAQAQQRIEAAQKRRDDAARELAGLDRLQSEVAKEADAFEMRARVHLDKEEVKDVDSLTPERAQARRTAAKQLAAEARVLCLAARLLDAKSPGLQQAQQKADRVDLELSQGSVKDDLFPRSAAARAECLEVLSHTRRPVIKEAPQSEESDRLFSSLTETQKLFAYRDDRGIVVNIGSPLDGTGALTDATSERLSLLGRTAKANKKYPLLVIAHTARNTEMNRAEQMLEAAVAALEAAGAPQVQRHAILGAQPVVQASLPGSAEKNERLEVVFVVPGR